MQAAGLGSNSGVDPRVSNFAGNQTSVNFLALPGLAKSGSTSNPGQDDASYSLPLRSMQRPDSLQLGGIADLQSTV